MNTSHAVLAGFSVATELDRTEFGFDSVTKAAGNVASSAGNVANAAASTAGDVAKTATSTAASSGLPGADLAGAALNTVTGSGSNEDVAMAAFSALGKVAPMPFALMGQMIPNKKTTKEVVNLVGCVQQQVLHSYVRVISSMSCKLEVDGKNVEFPMEKLNKLAMNAKLSIPIRTEGSVIFRARNGAELCRVMMAVKQTFTEVEALLESPNGLGSTCFDAAYVPGSGAATTAQGKNPAGDAINFASNMAGSGGAKNAALNLANAAAGGNAKNAALNLANAAAGGNAKNAALNLANAAAGGNAKNAALNLANAAAGGKLNAAAMSGISKPAGQNTAFIQLPGLSSIGGGAKMMANAAGGGDAMKSALNVANSAAGGDATKAAMNLATSAVGAGGAGKTSEDAKRAALLFVKAGRSIVHKLGFVISNLVARRESELCAKLEQMPFKINFEVDSRMVYLEVEDLPTACAISTAIPKMAVDFGAVVKAVVLDVENSGGITGVASGMANMATGGGSKTGAPELPDFAGFQLPVPKFPPTGQLDLFQLAANIIVKITDISFNFAEIALAQIPLDKCTLILMDGSSVSYTKEQLCSLRLNAEVDLQALLDRIVTKVKVPGIKMGTANAYGVCMLISAVQRTFEGAVKAKDEMKFRSERTNSATETARGTRGVHRQPERQATLQPTDISDFYADQDDDGFLEIVEALRSNLESMNKEETNVEREIVSDSDTAFVEEGRAFPDPTKLAGSVASQATKTAGNVASMDPTGVSGAVMGAVGGLSGDPAKLVGDIVDTIIRRQVIEPMRMIATAFKYIPDAITECDAYFTHLKTLQTASATGVVTPSFVEEGPQLNSIDMCAGAEDEPTWDGTDIGKIPLDVQVVIPGTPNEPIFILSSKDVRAQCTVGTALMRVSQDLAKQAGENAGGSLNADTAGAALNKGAEVGGKALSALSGGGGSLLS